MPTPTTNTFRPISLILLLPSRAAGDFGARIPYQECAVRETRRGHRRHGLTSRALSCTVACAMALPYDGSLLVPRRTALERALGVFTDVRAGEGVTALVMVANVFLILCAYYFVKPLRDG